MSLIRFYTYRDKLLVPTVVRAEAGFYLDSEPVTVCSITDQARARQCIESALVAGNDSIPTPDPSDDPGSVILDRLSIRKWLTFEKDAAMYTVQIIDGVIHYYSSGKAIEGSWRADQVRHMTFQQVDGLKSPLDSIMNDIARDSEQWAAESKPKSGALMLLPPAPEKQSKDS